MTPCGQRHDVFGPDREIAPGSCSPD